MADSCGLGARGREEQGFTLIELLIVIVILGVLAGLTVFALGGLNTDAAVAACRADFKAVESAQEAYRAQVGSPATQIDLLQKPGIGADGSVVGPWLKDALSNTNLYVIGIDDGIPGGSQGDITVQSVNPLRAAQDGYANCAYA